MGTSAGYLNFGILSGTGAVVINTSAQLDDAKLSIVGSVRAFGVQIGNAGFSSSSLVNQLANGLMLRGYDTNTQGAHIQCYTSADQYPIFQQLNYAHDNVSLNFDCYFDGAWKSASTTASYQISKLAGTLNFNYAAATTVGVGTPINTAMSINSSGNIGIGTTSPQYMLDIYSQGVNPLRIGGGSYPNVLCVSSIYVGINTSTPSYYLDCNGNARFTGTAYFQGTDSIAMGTISYITSSTTVYNSAQGTNTAQYAIVGGRGRFSQVDVFSSKYLKKNVQDRDGKKDLDMLMIVPMKQFEYIDKIQHPDEDNIGVIAEDMESIIPECVKQHPDFIPNFYEVRDISEIDDTSFVVDGKFDEKTGTKIKFCYVKNGTEKRAEGVACDGGVISHKEGSMNVSQIFLYGIQREDVKSVNYNTLYSLNISATQELYKMIQEQKSIIETLSDRIKQLEKYSFTL